MIELKEIFVKYKDLRKQENDLKEQMKKDIDRLLGESARVYISDSYVSVTIDDFSATIKENDINVKSNICTNNMTAEQYKEYLYRLSVFENKAVLVKYYLFDIDDTIAEEHY